MIENSVWGSKIIKKLPFWCKNVIKSPVFESILHYKNGNTWCYNTSRKDYEVEVLSMSNIIDIREKVDSILQNTDLNSIPISVTSIAKYYGFKVFEMELGSNCSGMIMVKDTIIEGLNTNKAIIVNSNDSDQRKRFTVAHELGHYFLEGESKTCFGHRDVGDYSPRERDANSFASELLMPKTKVENFVKEYKDSVWGDIPDSFIIDAVASNFHVSRSAANVRLEKLNII